MNGFDEIDKQDTEPDRLAGEAENDRSFQPSLAADPPPGPPGQVAPRNLDGAAHPLDRASRERVSYVDDFLIAAHQSSAAHLEELANCGFAGSWQGCPKRLRQLLLDCRMAAERRGFSPDAKREIFMRRPGGVLVLADPFLVARRGAHPRPGRLVPGMATLG